MPFPLWVWGGAALVALTGFFNLGIIAIDDYNNGFAAMVPASRAPSLDALFSQPLFPVIPKILLKALAAFYSLLGAEHPVTQLRLSLATLGLGCFAANLWSARRLFQTSPALPFAYFFVCFYFALPLFSTRPMNETLCMPLLTLSSVFAAQYGQTGNRRALVLATVWLALASCMRFQAGICGLALVFLVAYRRDRAASLHLGASALGLFVLTGLPDLFYAGHFHSHLFQYLHYNLESSASHYGAMPATVFLFLAIALTLPPAFFSLYRGWNARKEYRPLTALVLYLVIFLIAHSASPHKEERFFIPILPVFLFCLVPAARFLWDQRVVWRRVWFLGFNALLLFLACTNVPQQNLLALAAWLDSHPSVNTVEALDKSLFIAPQAFLQRPVSWHGGNTADYRSDSCTTLTVVRADLVFATDAPFRLVGRFEPGWVEQVLVRLNPKNARRGPLLGYLPASCPISE